MFKYLRRSLALLFVASAVGAQWGASPSGNQPNHTVGQGADTILVDAGRARIELPDSTLSTNASGYKIIVGDLRDPAVMWDLEAFRAAERNRSDIRAGGTPFPTRYLIHITTGQDSVVIRNRDDMSAWMVFETVAGDMLGSATVSDVHFLDGIIYVTDSSASQGFLWIDLVLDKSYTIYTGAKTLYKGSISTRNDASGYATVASSPVIANNTVNAIDAIRDPFGLPMQDGSGRTAHWWVAHTSGGPSLYNPHANAIYDGATGTHLDADLLPNGSFVHTRSGGTRDALGFARSILNVTADSWDANTGGNWQNTQSGSEDLIYGNAQVFSALAVIPNASASGEQAPRIVMGAGTEGLALLHARPSDNNGGGITYLYAASQHAPYMKGDAVGAYAFDAGAWSDFSPYADALTAVGTPGQVAAVFGDGYSSTSDSYVKDEGDSKFNDPRSVSLWFKSASATNPSAAEALIWLEDEVGATDDRMITQLQTDGTLFAVVADGSASDQIDKFGTTDVYDGNWHHYALVLRTSSLDMYLDGELHGQDASLAVTLGSIDTDTLAIGANHSSGSYGSFFNGFIDHVAISKDELTASEIRGMYQDGLKAMQSDVDAADVSHNANVDYATCIEGWCATGYTDSVTVWAVGSTTLIPAARYGTPAGNIQDVAIWMEPGADSVSVFLATTTRLQAIQPDPLIASAAAHRWPYVQPVIGSPAVVDSAGAGDFWNVDDAIDAAANAGQGLIQIGPGHFGSFDADQVGQIISGSGRGITIIDGGTTDDAIDVTADSVTIEGLTVKTDVGGGNVFDGVDVGNADAVLVRDVAIRGSDYMGINSTSSSATNLRIENVFVFDADQDCFWIASYGAAISNSWCNTAGNYGLGTATAANYGSMSNTYIQSASSHGVLINAPGWTLTGNHVASVTGDCYQVNSSGDNATLVGNHAVTCADGIELTAGADNSVVVGNNTTGEGVVDGSTGSTVANNE